LKQELVDGLVEYYLDPILRRSGSLNDLNFLIENYEISEEKQELIISAGTNSSLLFFIKGSAYDVFSTLTKKTKSKKIQEKLFNSSYGYKNLLFENPNLHDDIKRLLFESWEHANAIVDLCKFSPLTNELFSYFIKKNPAAVLSAAPYIRLTDEQSNEILKTLAILKIQRILEK